MSKANKANESLIELFNGFLVVYKQLQWAKEVIIGSVHYNYCPLCDQPEGKGHVESCPCFEMNERLLTYGKQIIEKVCEGKK